MKTTLGTTALVGRTSRVRARALLTMLQDRQREMRDLLHRRLRDAPAGGPDSGLDEAELADADSQEHIAVAVIQLQVDALEQLQDALARLDAGEYGNCADCGAEISEVRLSALPFAVRCTSCAALREQDLARERRFAPSLESA
jgi:DnaK suppressor protein